MNCFVQRLAALPGFEELRKASESGRLPALVTGVSDVTRAHFALALALETEKPVLLLSNDDNKAMRMCDDINTLAGADIAAFFPARDFQMREAEGVSRETEQVRISVLGRLLSGGVKVVTAPADAAVSATMPAPVLKRSTFRLQAGQELPQREIVGALQRAGYVRRDFVEGICQYSVRGGIIDFYSPQLSMPVRVELWGDTIDTISTFDIVSQRRQDTMKAVEILPAAEVLAEDPQRLADTLEALLEKEKNEAKADTIRRDLDALRTDREPPCPDRLLPLVYGAPTVLYDYFADGLVCLCDFTACKERMEGFCDLLKEDMVSLLEEGTLYAPHAEYARSVPRFIEDFHRNGVVFESFPRSLHELRLGTLADVHAATNSGWSGKLSALTEELDNYRDGGYATVLFAGTAKTAKVLTQDLVREGFDAVFQETRSGTLEPRSITVFAGTLSGGFEYPDIGLGVISYRSTVRGKLSGRKHRKNEEKIRSLEDLKRGDYLVHISHGIGVFDGIRKMELSGGVVKDYLKIRYQGSDVLYVPVTQLDLVSKYIGVTDEGHVRLNKLSGDAWQNTKARVKAAASDMAKELLQMYAKREAAKGFAFSEDDDMMRDFEGRFPYEETEDQLRCIEEIKRDMQRPHPMDRLLCGDVGFGKTEVALRAAFKAVEDGKQVAILVPTTILAWQHYNTLLERFEGFPVNIELLSRFRTKAQQAKILKQLADGRLDIVVGTHRLVQKDVKFKDLGLVIVDEEQRFGVAHKERFKSNFEGVDVLTLSATPIPRTLNMAMSGIRDMSVLEQPPMDRLPVQTYVMEYSEGVVCDAIRKELRRGGQVYYLHNRVESISATAAMLQRRFPDYTVGIGHGKMNEEELSEVWEQVLNHEVDILVCTSIIETGIDVPNCNTLIVEDADRLGLAQLYQLRGRVGRSSRRAYAYLTFRRGRTVSEVAAKRLNAIKEFTKFGSGFKIAMRDLEIRGAGNILGASQHGHMACVGYDLYLRLLSEAVSELQGGAPDTSATLECLVDIQIDAHIPESYIDSNAARIEIYRRIASIKTEEDMEDVYDELIDRFGDPPPSVEGLVKVALLRNIAAGHGIYEIGQSVDKLLFHLDTVDMDAMSYLAGQLKGSFMLSAGGKPYFSVRIGKGENALSVMERTIRLLGGRPKA